MESKKKRKKKERVAYMRRKSLTENILDGVKQNFFSVFFLGFWYCKAESARHWQSLHPGVLYCKLDGAGLDWMAENFT
jgi:hypothetical protein